MTPHSSSHPAPSRHRSRRGLALVVTVSMLAMMLILVVALMNTTGDHYKESSVIANGHQARLTGQTAVGVALSQLRNATSQTFSNGRPKPWTSQPGGIRIHKMDGSLDSLVKLYSSDVPEVSSVAATAADIPDNWSARPDHFVDLNEPQTLPGGEVSFPVVDPRASSEDPLNAVEGFSYLEQKGALGPRGRTADAQRLPMPVRWIYVLQDGTLGTLNEDGLFEGPNEARASRNNPIVSRFAYWTDDETSKVNVNTASEGAFWDTPRADTPQERALARSIPSRLEYMRQPGHPAGVSLSSVLLPNRRIAPLEFPSYGSSGMRPMAFEDARDLWRLGRLTVAEKGDGTSRGGTAFADWASLWSTAPRESVRQPRYAVLEELAFDHVNSARFPGMWGNGDAPKKGERRRSRLFQEHPDAFARLKHGQFFLTTRSAGPETTLFGTPRVAMWPVPRDTMLNTDSLGDPTMSRDTMYSHKVTVASSLKKKPYFVMRSAPSDGKMDYLEPMGEGTNKGVFDYLQRLTDTPFPGFERAVTGSSTFAGKYGEDRDAILLEMMDYVRAANFAEHQLPNLIQFSVLCPGQEHHGFGQISPLQLLNSNRKQPSTSDHVQGIGRLMTISEVALIITCRARVDADKEIQGEPSDENTSLLTEPGDREFDVGFLVETFLPGHGWTDYRPYTTMALVGGAPGAEVNADHRKAALPVYLLNGEPLVQRDEPTTVESAEFPPTGWHGAGGSLGVRSVPHKVLQFKPVVLKAAKVQESAALQFQLQAGDPNQIKVALYDSPGSTGSEDLVQIVPLTLPDIHPEAKIPLPSLAMDTVSPDLETRILRAAEKGGTFIASTDVVQGLAPAHGDYRLTAARRWQVSKKGDININLFTPHPRWGHDRLAHNLRDQILPVQPDQHRGYVEDLNYPADFRPDVPEFLASASGGDAPAPPSTGAQQSFSNVIEAVRLDRELRGSIHPGITGDFDNGIASAPDGPYTNRPDDGHWSAVKDGKIPYFDNVSQVASRVPPVTLTAFSPQRLIPSPVMFGSLPTGVRVHVPWQTLLFRPHPGHYGANTPPDHLLLDLFWTPVLEPEPLSNNLETEGKINLNHEILPFRHITRATALHAAMKAETLMAIPDSAAGTYKTGADPMSRFRHHLDPKQTLGLWKKEIFDRGDVFLTAGQICEQYLVPEGLTDPAFETTVADMQAFWAKHRLTGDNSKERPYAHLYSRFTTRSNTYRVHFVAQSLTKARSTDARVFDSKKDRVAASISGSALLSRKIDQTHKDLPDYQASGTHEPLDKFYTWSIGPVAPVR